MAKGRAPGNKRRYRGSRPKSNDGPWSSQPSNRTQVDIGGLVRGSDTRRIDTVGQSCLSELTLVGVYARDVAYIMLVLDEVEGYFGPVDKDTAELLVGAYPAVRDCQRGMNLNGSRQSDTDLTPGLVAEVMQLDARQIRSQYGSGVGDVVDYMQGVCENL